MVTTAVQIQMSINSYMFKWHASTAYRYIYIYSTWALNQKEMMYNRNVASFKINIVQYILYGFILDVNVSIVLIGWLIYSSSIK